MNNIAVAIDVEHDSGRLIEVGLSLIDLSGCSIINKYSVPVKIDFDLSWQIIKLTGWTPPKLAKQGYDKTEVARRVIKYCGRNRLLVTDMDNEIPFIEEQLGIKLSLNRLNICTLFKLKRKDLTDNVGIDIMLEYFGLTFEGKQHRGVDDSYNIAKLFLEIVK